MLLDCRLIVRDRTIRSEEARWFVGLEEDRASEADISVGDLPIPEEGGETPPIELYSNDLCYDRGQDHVIKTVEQVGDRDDPLIVERHYITDKNRRRGQLFRVVHRHTNRRIRRYVIPPLISDVPRVIDPMGLVILRTLRYFNREKSCFIAEKIYEVYNDIQTSCRALEYYHTPAPMRFDMHTLVSALSETVMEFDAKQISAQSATDTVADFLRDIPNYRAIPPVDSYTNIHVGQSSVNMERVISRYNRRQMDTSPCRPLTMRMATYPNLSYFSDFLDEVTSLNLTDFHVWFRDDGMEIDYVVNRYAPFQDLRSMLPENEINPALRDSLLEGYYQARGGGGIDSIEVTLTYDDELLLVFHEECGDRYEVYFDLNRCALLAPAAAINSMTSSYMTGLSDSEYNIRDVTHWD